MKVPNLASFTPSLSVEDASSPTWKRIEKMLDERVAELRERNDAQHDETETASIRGQIKAIKWVLALAERASASKAISPRELAGGDGYGPHGPEYD